MESTKQKNFALPIAMMFALFFMISFVTGLQNPMGVIVKNQFGASNFMAQLGNAANFIAYAFMGIPSGMLLQRIGYKKTALAAIVVGFFGVGISFLSGQVASFSVYLTGAFISGFSMCMLNAVVNPMLNTLGGGGKKGNQFIQFGGSINSIGATIVPVLVGYLMGDAAKATINDASPALFLAMGIFALTFIVLFFVDIPEPHKISAEKAVVKEKHSAMSFRHFILGTVAIFLYVGVEVGIPNIANLFMTSPTITQATALVTEYEKQQADASYLAQIKTDDATNKDNKEYTTKEVKNDSFENAQKVISGEASEGLGINTTVAGTLVGTYWFLMLIGRLIGASLGAKFTSKAMLIFVSALGIIFILSSIFSSITTTVSMPVFRSDISFGLTEVPISIMFLILCGLCTSVMWGGIFNLAVEGLGKYTAAASGIFMVMVCGGGIVPLIQGSMADSFGYVASYWVIFACLVYMLYYAFIGCKNVNTDIPVE